MAANVRPAVRSARRMLSLSTLVLAAALLAAVACGNDAQQPEPQADQPPAAEDQPTVPLKLGLLLDFSGPLAEYGPEMQRGFELAVEHINEAGGVWGMPVETAQGDTAQDPTSAVEEARRLIEIEGVHGIVGPISSAMTLAVSESVSGPAQVPTITPVATSSQVTLAEDDDFLFRLALSDVVEGQYLAQLAADQGYDSVGLLYRDDAFGQGLATAFERHWTGDVTSVAVNDASTSFSAELEQSLALEPQALVVIGFPPETILIVRNALELGYYDQFVFGAGAKTTTVSEAIGAAPLAGMRGTVVAPAPESASSEAWSRDFIAAYGEAPNLPYVKEAYDATIALALAAQAAGSSNGAAIRDQLRRIGSAPGLVVIASVESLRAGLAAAADGDDIDYEGVAGTIDWDEYGDSSRGYIGIWEFAADGSITDLETIPYGAE